MASRISLTHCQQCGQGLDLGLVSRPILGLVPVRCPRCRHETLYSGDELRQAQSLIAQGQPMPSPFGFWDSMRRFLVS